MNQDNKEKNIYDGKSISILEGVEAIRKYPGMYIGDASKPNHLFYEIIDNAVDEAMMGHCNKLEIIIVNECSIIVRDNGRGIPIDIHTKTGMRACELVFLKIHAGGKFDSKAYSKSGGLHGVGLTAVNALSNVLKVNIYRDNKHCTMLFEKGILKNTTIVENIITNNQNCGTSIEIIADETIFECAKFDINSMLDRLKYISALNKYLEISFENKITSEKFNVIAELGIESLIIEKIQESVLPQNFKIEATEGEIEVEGFFNWDKDQKDEHFIAFTNCIIQKDFGSHINGLKSGILMFLQELKELNEIVEQLSWVDVKPGIKGVISIKTQSPKFDSQAKNRLVSTDVRKKVEILTYKTLKEKYRSNFSLIQPIVDQIKNMLLSRIVKSKKEEFHLSAFMHEGRLIDCREKDPMKKELFIVEGESAGGSIKQCRDKNTQAILTLRGKILNIEKANLRQITSSETLSIIASALGGKYMHNGTVKIDEIRYGKIIILVDADVDGSHIRSLLLNLFYRHMPEIIQNSHVYVVIPPLYRVQSKDKSIYFNKQDELIIFLTDYIIGKQLQQLNLNEDSRAIIETLIKIFNENLEIKKNEYMIILADILLTLKIKNHNDIVEKFEKIKEHISNTFVFTDCYIDNKEDVVIEDFIKMKKLVISKELFSFINSSVNKKINGHGAKNIQALDNTIRKIFGVGMISKIYSCYEKSQEDIMIQRFKGLGEMNPDQLYETSMDPLKRKLKLIEINDMLKANMVSTILMGDDAEKRRKFISDNYNLTAPKYE